MEKIRKKVNIAFILLALIVFGFAIAIGIIFTDSQAEADHSEDLVVSMIDTDEAHIVKISNIKEHSKGIATLSNTDSKVELGKEVYRLLGTSEEDINNMTDEKLIEVTEYDEVERQYSVFYAPETLSENGQTSVEVPISNPGNIRQPQTESLKGDLTLAVTFYRSYEKDYTSVVTNKDGEKVGEKFYMGLKICIDLNWNDPPVWTMKDKLYIFTDMKMKESETFRNSEKLTDEHPTGYYREYTPDLTKGKNRFTGSYYYGVNNSASLNFRVVYLHHCSLSLGFSGNVSVDSSKMNVSVDSKVIHSKYISNIYTVNAN